MAEQIIRWKTSDGRMFDSEQAANRHEEVLLEGEKLQMWLWDKSEHIKEEHVLGN